MSRAHQGFRTCLAVRPSPECPCPARDTAHCQSSSQEPDQRQIGLDRDASRLVIRAEQIRDGYQQVTCPAAGSVTVSELVRRARSRAPDTSAISRACSG